MMAGVPANSFPATSFPATTPALETSPQGEEASKDQIVPPLLLTRDVKRTLVQSSLINKRGISVTHAHPGPSRTSVDFNLRETEKLQPLEYKLTSIATAMTPQPPPPQTPPSAKSVYRVEQEEGERFELEPIAGVHGSGAKTESIPLESKDYRYK